MPAGELPQGIDDSKLPAERFSSSSEVHSLCRSLISADRRRNVLRSKIEGLWQGNPSASKQFMSQRGQGWRARVNHRGLEGICSTIETAIYNLDVEVPACVDIGLDFGKGSERRRWEQTIARHYTWMHLHKWQDSDFHIQRRIHEMTLHGMGYHFHNRKGDWIPRTPASGCVLFPDDCPINFNEDGEFFMVRDFVTGVQAYQFIRNEKAATALGWNVKKVWEWLSKISKSSNKSVDDPQEVERLMKQGDQGFSTTRRSGGWLNYLFVKEYDDEDQNGISLYVVGEKQDVGDYLFRRRYHLSDWPVHLFPYDIGNGTIQSVRGAGLRMKDYFELQNRIFNSMADQVLVGATMPMKQTVANLDPDKLKLMKVGLFSIIPQGLELAPGLQFPPLANGPLALEDRLHRSNLENNQTYVPQEPERQDRQTGSEYAMRSQNISQVGKGQCNFYYRGLGRYYDYTLRLAVKPQVGNSLSATLAKAFQKRCIADGVPPEAFQHIEEISPVRSVGSGSAAARLQALNIMLTTVYPNAPEEKKINLENDLAATLTSYSQADRYARSQDDQAIPTNDDSLITVENSVLSMGGQCTAASEQDQVKHADGHLAAGEALQQQLEQNGEQGAQQAIPVLQAFLQHTGQHLTFLQKNPMKQKEFAEFEKRYNLLAQYGAHLDAIVAQEQKAAQLHGTPEQQVSEQGQVQMMKAQTDAKVKTYKAQQDSALKWAQFHGDNQRKNVETAATLLRANAQPPKAKAA